MLQYVLVELRSYHLNDRSLLFDYIGLEPTGKKTGTGADSTDAEVLKELAEKHEVPQLVLDIRQKVKIKTTYLDKIYPQLDRDSRLRTGFHLHGTTSGRLSWACPRASVRSQARASPPRASGCAARLPGAGTCRRDRASCRPLGRLLGCVR